MEIIKLNLIPSGVNPTCHCSQYDEGRVIRIELFDGLTPYTLKSGDTVTLNVRKPDNTIVTASVTTTQGNKYVDIVTTEQICACVGYNLCDLTITNGSVVIGTLNFIMQVERDVLADGIPSQSVIEDLDALVQEAVGDNYYTKTEVDDKLALKADSSDVAAALALKADASDVYTKTEVNNLLALKANKSDLYDILPTDTVSGDTVNLPDGANNAPVKRFKANIQAIQSGSGDPSPSNVRLISGFTEANIYRKGINLWDEVWESGSLSTTTGENQPNSNMIRSVNYIPCKPSTSYYLKATNPASYIWFYNKNQEFISYSMSTPNRVFTTPDNCYFMRLRVGDSSNHQTTYDNDISLNYPSTDTEYHAHSSGDVLYLISWSSEGTVYGGYLSYEFGVWSITKTHKVIDLGDESITWVKSPSVANLFYTNVIEDAIQSGTQPITCEIYTYTTRAASDMPMYSDKLYQGRVYAIDDRYSDATSYKTDVSGVKLLYELAEPQTVALGDDTVIETMFGVNNFYADCGAVELTYRADIGLYIDKRVSQIPAALSLSRGLETITQREEPIETPTNDEER